jgi:FKBP-type peptidyl-prolyl cis-trans isomerase FkpA
MRRLALAAVAAVILAAPFARAADPKIETDEQKTLYAIGLSLARNLTPFELTPDELAVVEAGMHDGLFAKESERKADINTYGPKIQELAQARAKKAAEKEKQASAAFLEKAAKEPGAEKTASGLIYSETTKGTGPQPAATDTVKVHYTGTLMDGTVFDSSRERGQPATFPLNGVIKCWTEGVAKMHQGGRAKLVCPSDIAYGDRGAPPKIKPGATLVFDVELLEVVKKDAPAAGGAAATTTTLPKK